MATCHHTPSMAGPAVCRQTPEVGAPCPSGHAGICVAGAGKSAFLPQLGAAGGQPPAATRPPSKVKWSCLLNDPACVQGNRVSGLSESSINIRDCGERERQ